MGYDDLGKFHEETGNLPAALEAYTRMRTEISSLSQVFETNKKVVRVLVLQKDYGAALVALSKMTPPAVPEDDIHFGGSIGVIRGLCLLGLGRFDEATKTLVNATPSDPKKFIEFMSPNDVAVYGGLLALATMSRSALEEEVLNSPHFRYYLTFETHIRKAISLFVNCRYAACLEILKPYWPDYLLDIHLHASAETLRTKIRTRCITQFLAPFSTISFDTLRQQFDTDQDALVEELVKMIEAGELPHARLDLEQGVRTKCHTQYFDILHN